MNAESSRKVSRPNPAAEPASGSASPGAEKEFRALDLAPGVLAFFLLATVACCVNHWWTDEGYTWFWMNKKWGEMLQCIADDVHPPLFFLLLRAWMELWPDPVGMRVFVMLTTVPAVVLGGLLAGRLYGPRAAGWGALLLGTFPLVAYRGQDARMYGMGLSLVMLIYTGWSMAPRRPRLGWILAAAGMGLGLWTHYHLGIVSAMLVGGESILALAQLWRARVEAGPDGSTLRRAARRRLAWILSAGLAGGLIFAPHLSTLLAQMRRPTLLQYFSAPDSCEFWASMALYGPTLFKYQSWWIWIVGLTWMAALPILGLWRAVGNGEDAIDWNAGGEGTPALDATTGWDRARWFPSATALAGILFLYVFSLLVMPVLEFSRVSMLFLPLIILPGAAFLAWNGRKGMSRMIRTALAVIVLGANGLYVLTQPLTYDLRPLIDQTLDRARLDQPIYTYPLTHPFRELMWRPLAVVTTNTAEEVPETLDRCTLVVLAGGDPDRYEKLDHVRAMLGQVRQIQPLVTDYEWAAYDLQGIPPGVTRSLIGRMPGIGLESFMERLAGIEPVLALDADALAPRLDPTGRTYSLSSLNPDWRGALLRGRENKLRLEAPPAAEGHFRALLVDIHVISAMPWNKTELRVPGRPILGSNLQAGRHLLAQLIPPGAASVDFSLQIPTESLRTPRAAKGDAPHGVYLLNAALANLPYTGLRSDSGEGLQIPVGTVGDQLYLRGSFFEREGMPPQEVRWTHRSFALDLPVPEGAEYREVVLTGFLPAGIRDRRIRLFAGEPRLTAESHGAGDSENPEARAGDEGQDAESGETKPIQPDAEFETGFMESEAVASTPDYGDVVFRLPRPLDPGVQRLRFELGGVYVPKEHGQGPDPRRLGFFLNSLTVR